MRRRVACTLSALALFAGCSGDVGDSRAKAAGGSIVITASGEVLAQMGYPFPPGAGQDAFFVDGWDVSFEHVVVTFDDVTLSENPDRAPTDESQTGAVVARVRGPWAIDLHAIDPADPRVVGGKGGAGELAVVLGRLDGQNENGGAPFDPESRYALGFRIVPATDAATKIFVADDVYADMIARGWTTLLEGTARFRGTGCRQADSSSPTPYDFASLPTTVHFRFGFSGPAEYVNCQNPDNDPAEPFEGEEHLRGVQVRSNQAVYAQLTLHTDHVFWDTLTHDSTPHFDPFAAYAKTSTDGATVTLDDIAGASFRAWIDPSGRPIPWRSCVDPSLYRMPATTPMSYDAGSLSLATFGDFFLAAAHTMGHLDADGLCYVR